MNRPPYFRHGLAHLLLVLPLLFQAALIGFGLLSILSIVGGIETAGWIIMPVGGVVFLSFCFVKGKRAVRPGLLPGGPAANIPGPFHIRYLSVILAFGYTLTIALIGMFLPIPQEGGLYQRFLSLFVIAHITSSPAIAVTQLMSVKSPWIHLAVPLVIYATYTAGMFQSFRASRTPRSTGKGAAILLPLGLAALSLIIWRGQQMRGQVIMGESEETFPDAVDTSAYRPLSKNNRLIRFPDPGIAFTSDFPRLDGATAAYPVYAAAAQAIYRYPPEADFDQLVRTSTTPVAYERLISGKVDVIFVARPSPKQLADAKAAGVTLRLTPIGKEAFVFFVHNSNPVNGLSTTQIRAIYTKKLTHWSEVGGTRDKIAAFQRPKGSGSQTAMELKVMAGEKLPPPLREEFAEGMGGVMQRVASYKNSLSAIGYSFRFFATTMNPVKDLKLLEIDGISPTRENIRSGAYPFTVDVFAVTAGTSNPNAQALVDWFLSPKGQQLIDETGYVSMSPP